MKPLVRKILAAIAVLAVGAVTGPWVYINLIKDQAPEALTLEPTTTTTNIDVESSTTVVAESTTTTVLATSAVEGEWVTASDSIVGYRVKETIVGQKTEGVGRTSAITGTRASPDRRR
ncbi:MAG: hypothetical protein EB089_08035 [Acidimicrobiia bacterium]|nr:hypothetical protein [Acidimicrobiia bacterium]